MKKTIVLKQGKCSECEKIGIHAKNLCQACYSKNRRQTPEGKKEKAIEYAKKRLHCKHPREQRSYIGNNLLSCNVCGLVFS